MFSLKNRAVLAHFLSPAQRKSWGGKLWRGINRPSGRLSSRTSVRIFRFRNTWQKPMGDLFHIAHTHLLGGIDVHFGGTLGLFSDLHLSAIFNYFDILWNKFKFKCLFFKPHMEEYKKITVNVISKTYNITHNNVYIIIQSITVFSLHTF